MLGTMINVAAILLGSAIGVAAGDRLPQRMRDGLMHALGLVVLLVGIDAGLQAFREPLASFTRVSVVIVMGSVLVGGIVGEMLRIEDRLDSVGERLRARFGKGHTHFTEGFVAASLLFCVGPMAILGSIRSGLDGDHQLLTVKALLDGFAALGFASTLGIGVGFSVLPVLAYQGSLTLLSGAVAEAFTPEMIAAITASGGVLVAGIALRLLELRQVRVGNLLPALLIAPAIVAVMHRFA